MTAPENELIVEGYPAAFVVARKGYCDAVAFTSQWARIARVSHGESSRVAQQLDKFADSAMATIKAQQREIDKLRLALIGILPTHDDYDWWCPCCKEAVVATNTERCDSCGTDISDCQPDTGWLSDARELLKQEATGE